jgi:hypothetical protein
MLNQLFIVVEVKIYKFSYRARESKRLGLRNRHDLGNQLGSLKSTPNENEKKIVLLQCETLECSIKSPVSPKTAKNHRRYQVFALC